MRNVLTKLAHRQPLSEKESYETMNIVLKDASTDGEIAAFLMGLRTKGERIEELAGILHALQDNVLLIPYEGDFLFDNCGTGGDGLKTFNVSTTTAFVCSGAGMTVAKHGNRSITSKSGSADVLQALGANIHGTPEQLANQLYTNGITFLFAQHVHPKLGRIGRIRKELGIVTAFNTLGPLANPMKLTHQLVGVFQKEMIHETAQLLQKLGRKKAIVLHGSPGVDEATLAGVTDMAIVTKETITFEQIDPRQFGFKRRGIEEIVGADSLRNKDIMLSVLRGEQNAYYETVLLNSGLCLYAGEFVSTIEEGIELAKETIKEKKALTSLYNYVRSSREGMGKDDLFRNDLISKA
ncbi:MAG: anthranilate phosphoribosyltransferase [Bacillaceae bacterium]